MKKLKNESELLKKAIDVAEKYAINRGYKGFDSTNSAKDKIEVLYRLLVKDDETHDPKYLNLTLPFVLLI